MAEPLDIPVRTAGASGAVEQHIDPWSVSAAKDADGNVLAFDYPAISQ